MTKKTDDTTTMVALMTGGGILGGLLMVFLAAFTSWGFEPSTWEAPLRFIFAILFVIFIAFGAFLGLESYKEKKKH